MKVGCISGYDLQPLCAAAAGNKPLAVFALWSAWCTILSKCITCAGWALSPRAPYMYNNNNSRRHIMGDLHTRCQRWVMALAPFLIFRWRDLIWSIVLCDDEARANEFFMRVPDEFCVSNYTSMNPAKVSIHRWESGFLFHSSRRGCPDNNNIKQLHANIIKNNFRVRNPRTRLVCFIF